MLSPANKKRIPGKITRYLPKPHAQDIQVSYIRDPGALRTQDMTDGVWQGRMITPDLLSPETLRYVAARSQVFNTILRNLQTEVARFARRPMYEGDFGFSVVPKRRNHHMTEAEKKEAARLEDFFLKTGYYYNPSREDTLRSYLVKQTYNRYVYDRMATQIVWGQATPKEFFAVEGASIIKVKPDVYIPQTERGRAVAPIKYIQIHKDQVWAEFNSSEMLVGICNPSPNLASNDYGWPELMDLIDPITLEISILTYIDRLLTQGSVPEGLLIIKTARTGHTVESLSLASGQSNEDFATILRNQVAGPQNAGRLAVLRLRGGEEAKLEINDRDLDKMPFVQTYEIVQNQIARKIGVDPADVGIVTGSIKNSFTDQDAKPGRIRQSRSRATTNLLLAIADTQLNPMLDFLNPDFCVHWHGIDAQYEQEMLNLEEMRMGMGTLTLNEVIAHQNGVPYPEDEDHWWATVPLRPEIFEAEAAKRGLSVAAKSKDKGGGGIGGEAGQRKPGAKPSNNANHSNE